MKLDPIPFRKADVSKLKGYDNVYRIRVGDLRIVYEVSWARRTIIINYIGPRGKAYRKTVHFIQDRVVHFIMTVLSKIVPAYNS